MNLSSLYLLVIWIADLFEVREGLLSKKSTLKAKGASGADDGGPTIIVELVAKCREDCTREAKKGMVMTSTSSSPSGSFRALPDEGSPYVESLGWGSGALIVAK